MRKPSKEYRDKLYELSSHLLPAIIALYPDMSESEAVDITTGYARSLLAELGYPYYVDKGE